MTGTDPTQATAVEEHDNVVDVSPPGPDAIDPQPEPDVAAVDARWASEARHATALMWVDPADVTADTAPEPETEASVFRGARLRPAITRARLLVPLAAASAMLATYAGAALIWPLREVAPTIQAVEFTPAAASKAEVTWPSRGSAAVGVGGMNMASSSAKVASIASITKVVTSLMVLDRMPLALGEQGPAFSFTYGDGLDYYSYLRTGQSALDVPVGGTLSEYQLLQGTLLGSANNYVDRLAKEIWGSHAAFAEAASTWLRERGISGITIESPSGFDERNVAKPAALIKLGELAMQNPVFAEIVGTKSVALPGAGKVTNTNPLFADPGVVGIKTGTLVGWNLLAAKDVTIGDTTVRLFAVTLNQPDDRQRIAATRALFAETEAALKAQPPAVPKGTVVGTVTTTWGENVDVVTDADASVVLWNGAAAKATPEFVLGDRREGGDKVGTLTTTGPLNTVTTPLTLDEDVEGPSPWWRLTHPLELLGLDKD